MASVIKYIARKFLFPFINYSGITTRISNQSENNLLILNYHGVIPEPDFSISPNHISTKDFDNELEYFSSKFNFINPEEFHSGNVSVKNNGKKNILLTFDDGYSNNFNYAFPILKKHKAPAIIFPVSSLINTNEATWYDKIDLTINHISETELRKVIASLKNDFFNQAIPNKRNLKNYLKQLSTKQKEEFFREYFQTAPQSPLVSENTKDFRLMLNEDQIKKMDESGLITFGSHTHTHPNLDNIHPNEVKEELSISKNILSSITGRPITSIAFPDGAYNENVKRLSKEAGFNVLYAVNYRTQSDNAQDNIYQRFSISNTTNAAATIFHASTGFKKSGLKI